MHVILLTHVVYADIKPIHILGWTVPSICQRTAEQQPLHMSGFLRVIYAILNASVILERNETRLARNETRLARNETRLARNETRGGNLPLSGTVFSCLRDYPLIVFRRQIHVTFIFTKMMSNDLLVQVAYLTANPIRLPVIKVHIQAFPLFIHILNLNSMLEGSCI